ncbi:MAG: hypothetical protein ACLS8T_41705 [Anaerobutyricum sp.]
MDSDALIETAKGFFNTNLAAAVVAARLDFHLDTLQETGCLYDLQCRLAGLAGITAGCMGIMVGAAAIGVVCEPDCTGDRIFDKIAKIDDPVGAVSDTVSRRCRNGSDRSVCHRGDYRGRTFLWRRRTFWESRY